MLLGTDELSLLQGAIIKLFPERIADALSTANRADELDELLRLLKMGELREDNEERLEVSEYGTMLVLGKSEVGEGKLQTCAKKLGLQKERLEFQLDYYAKGFDIKKLRYSSNYCAVLVGPVPHSRSGKNGSSSIIVEMESNPRIYPPVIRLMAGDKLKITVNSFKRALSYMLQQGKIKR